MKIRDIVLAVIIIGLLFFTYIKPEDSDAPGARQPTQERSATAPESLSDLEVLEQAIPATE